MGTQSRPQPLHLHRPQQVHHLRPLHSRLQRNPEPGHLELRLPRVRDQARGWSRPIDARCRLRELWRLRRLLPDRGVTEQDEPGAGPSQSGRESADHLLLLRRGLQLRPERAQRQDRQSHQR